VRSLAASLCFFRVMDRRAIGNPNIAILDRER
jgi:hypothetical protein